MKSSFGKINENAYNIPKKGVQQRTKKQLNNIIVGLMKQAKFTLQVPSKKELKTKFKFTVDDLNYVSETLDFEFKQWLINNFDVTRPELTARNHVKETVVNKPTITEPKQPVSVEVIQPEPTLEEHLLRIRALKGSTDRVKGQQSNIREGFLYVVVNPAWPNWVKIGQTTDYESRLRTYQTSSPHVDFSMAIVQYASDSLLEEQKILELASMRYQVRGEWINCSVTEIAGMM